MAKRNEVAKKKLDIDAGTVTWAFADNGQLIVIDLAKISEAKRLRAALLGISHTGGDSYAGCDGNIADARESVLGFQEMLYDDATDWSTRAPGEPRTAVLAEAIARAQSITLEAAKAGLAAIDAADKLLSDTDPNKGAVRKALNTHPAIKVARHELALEKAKADLANAPALAF
jgi:hypothetical protein